jgi:hypothetical protein
MTPLPMMITVSGRWWGIVGYCDCDILEAERPFCLGVKGKLLEQKN